MKDPSEPDPLVCNNCGRPIKIRAKRELNRKYCSQRCYLAKTRRRENTKIKLRKSTP